MKTFEVKPTLKEATMNKETTFEQCRRLKLYALAELLAQQELTAKYEEMPFLERLEILFNAQLQANSDKRIVALTKQAKLRYPNVFIEDIDYSLYPGLNVKVINKLALCDWITAHQHVAILGSTGVGKTSLACRLGQAAIRQHIPVLFYRLAFLLLELVAAKEEGTLVKLLRKINRAKLLILDDWGNTLMSDDERHLLFELIESRDQHGSLLITSQHPIASWHDAFQDSAIADSVLDRIVHSAHVIDRAKKPSIRELLSIRQGGELC